MTDAEDAAEKWWKEKMAEDVPNNDDLDDLAVAYLDGFELGKDAARARIAELEAALKPFADIDVSNCADGRVCYFWGFGENAGKVSAAEVRAARAAYLGEKDD